MTPKAGRTDPAWLQCSHQARKALEGFVARGRNRREILRVLDLLRAEFNRPGTGLGGLPTKRRLDRTLESFDKAAAKVTELVAPFHKLPEPLPTPESEEYIGREQERLGVPDEQTAWPNVQMVEWYLAVIRSTMMRLQAWVRSHGIRDTLRALIVAHTMNRKTGSFYDADVTELIGAATDEFRPEPYTSDAHKGWRHDHKDLITELFEATVKQKESDLATIELLIRWRRDDPRAKSDREDIKAWLEGVS